MESHASSLFIAFIVSAVMVTGCATHASTSQETPPPTAPVENVTQEPSPSPEVGELSITSSTDAAIPNDPGALTYPQPSSWRRSSSIPW